MDVDGDLSVCNQCGFPLYDAVMASHTKYSCCSADINNFDFWWVSRERYSNYKEAKVVALLSLVGE